MKNVIDEMIVKYSGNKQTFDSDTYVYAPDIDPDDNLDSPYHDRLHSKTAINIGKNTKSYILVEYMTGVKLYIT
jgi:hypothetical protein